MARAGLSVLGAGFSGTAGSVVFVRKRDGSTGVRERSASSDPRSAAQVRQRELMGWVNSFFRELDPAEMAAWRDYAERLAADAWAERRLMQANPLNAYRALALKFLQVNGITEPPRMPPVQAFGGDGIAVSVELGTTSFELGTSSLELRTSNVERAGSNLPPSTLNNLPSLSSGELVFTASGPNSPGVVTELLLQPLRLSISNPDPAKYRHGAFVQFESGSLEATLPSPAGWLSPAVRFVLAATGQTSGLIALPPVKVE